jgi:hypothetical protein
VYQGCERYAGPGQLRMHVLTAGQEADDAAHVSLRQQGYEKLLQLRARLMVHRLRL